MCGFPDFLIVEPTHIICWPERKSSNLCVTSLFILHIHSPPTLYYPRVHTAQFVCHHHLASAPQPSAACTCSRLCQCIHSEPWECTSSLIWPTLCSHSIDGTSSQWCCPTCCLVCSTACQLIVFHLASPPYAFPYDIPY